MLKQVPLLLVICAILSFPHCCSSTEKNETFALPRTVRFSAQSFPLTSALHNKADGYFYRKKGSFYILDQQSFSTSQFDELLERILKTEPSKGMNFDQLGITQQSLDEHMSDLVQLAKYPDSDWKSVAAIADQRVKIELQDAELVAKHILGTFAVEGFYTSVSFSSPSISSGRKIKKFSAESSGVVPFKLPWRIHVDNKSWTTYSTDVPLAILECLPAAQTHKESLDGRKWWHENFWKDKRSWYYGFVNALGRHVE